MSLFPEFVATLLDDLREVSPSTDRRGQPNWLKLGSTEYCWRCGGRFGGEIELGSHVWHHIIPASEGGPDSPDNKSLLCGNCHSVVHRFYLPTAKIGRKRTRDGASRLVGKFNGVEIFKKLPNPSHLTGHCHNCGKLGIVVGVSEGYWNGEGMLVFLDCPACGLKFAEPFIGTDETPVIDPISAICLAVTSGFNALSSKLPPELGAKVDQLMSALTSVLRDARSELNATERNARRAGCSDAEIEAKLNVVRQTYAKQLALLLPDAAKLEKECKPYTHA